MNRTLTTEEQVRAWYGLTPTASLPRSATDILRLASGLYAAWRSFESGRDIPPGPEPPPNQFFHVATELISLSRRGNFETAEHILWDDPTLP